MEPTARLAAILGLSLMGCAASAATPESEFTDVASTRPADEPAAAPSSPEMSEALRAGGPQFGRPAGEAPVAVACAPSVEPVPGCFITHDVDTNTLAADVMLTCGSQKQASNGCSSKPLAFEFVDEWATRPAKLTIAFDTAFFCAAGGTLMQVVEINGMPVGSFEGNPTDCNCQATSRQRVIEVAGDSLGMLKPGLMNRVSIVGPNHCLALRARPEWNGAYARITSTY